MIRLRLTTQTSFYVEINQNRAELTTYKAKALHEQLETVTVERVSALKEVGEDSPRANGKGREGGPALDNEADVVAIAGGKQAEWGLGSPDVARK